MFTFGKMSEILCYSLDATSTKGQPTAITGFNTVTRHYLLFRKLTVIRNVRKVRKVDGRT